ncbi:DUF177 domain-containing protein [Macrococcus sp. DPC7161]|uniref:YceD family protein n=1 Tax=Macrococcus sp. DPC7161 TaxID=2507060 RepID=UPI00100BDA71|nr:YceD family protein [Macrococcus sp. DPC7161]RXK18881.1 DUF177 domain-containing protein [Macrococcus sp. DPC7161]
MKWSITELNKHRNEPFLFESDITLEHLVKDLQLIDLSSVHVSGNLNIKRHEVIADINITGQYVMTCARSLEDVAVPFDISSIEIFDEGDFDIEEDENRHEIVNGVIDLKPVIEELIVINKPVRVVKEDVELEQLKGNGWEVIDESQLLEEAEPKVDPRFAKLQNLKFSDES